MEARPVVTEGKHRPREPEFLRYRASGGLRIISRSFPQIRVCRAGSPADLDEVVGGSDAIVVNRHRASASTAEDIEHLRTWSPNPRTTKFSLDLLLTADVDIVIGRSIRLVITAGRAGRSPCED
ncbi:MAG: hypothetical protein ACRDS0_36185 [Pseudonocardiaceae bacterium]